MVLVAILAYQIHSWLHIYIHRVVWMGARVTTRITPILGLVNPWGEAWIVLLSQTTAVAANQPMPPRQASSQPRTTENFSTSGSTASRGTVGPSTQLSLHNNEENMEVDETAAASPSSSLGLFDQDE